MKRTALKRGKPLKRGTKGLKKSRLSPMSKEKSKWMKLYREQCKKNQRGKGMERHHPMGRRGEFLLCWVWVTWNAHEWIHRNGAQSRKIGWLLAPYEGRPYDPSEGRAWSLAQESWWPEKYRRLAS